jgi:tetratricopeptide (TPR) repeat protein
VQKVARVVLSVLTIGVCLLLMQSAARIGFSRLLSRYAVAANSLPAADQAIRLTAADPDAHRARAVVLTRLRYFAEAEASFETAATLRPGQPGLWLALGNTREESGDNEGALAALNEAVRAAPYYGQTHWQRGNLLLRMGRNDEAIADLRLAAASDRRLLPSFMDLAWGLSGGVAKYTEELIQLNNDQDRLQFLRFLARKGKGPEVVEQVRLLNTPLSEENKQELTRLLMASRKFRDAFGLWKGTAGSRGIVNGGFEEPLAFKNANFGWVFAEAQAKVKFAVDVSEPFSGAKSLQVTFNGEWNPGALSQTIVLAPGRYRITFAARTNELVTGAPLRMAVTNATNNQMIGSSEAFPPASESWQVLGVEFAVPADAEAVELRLARDTCASAPCPIFGVVWLDDFSLQKL